MSERTVSIIIPAYNTAPYIAETLDSVFAQTFTDYEIIVINDGSPDTTQLEQALVPYRDRITYIVQENRGLSAARNTGIRAVRTGLVAFLDSDDLWERDYLAFQVDMMRRDISIDVLYPNAITFGDRLRGGRRFMDIHPSQGEATFESVLTQQCNVMVSVTAKRSAIVAAGMFDESLRSSEDFDLWLRILWRGGRIAYHRRPLVRRRLRPGSLTADPVWMCEHILRVIDKVGRTMSLTPAERELVAGRRAYFHATLRLHQSKRAFFNRDARQAIDMLGEANAHFGSRKIDLALVLLRLAPGLLLRAYDLRDRLVFKTNTKC